MEDTTDMKMDMQDETHIYAVAGQSNAGAIARRGDVEAAFAAAGIAGTIVKTVEGGTSLAPAPGELDWYPFEDDDPATGELFVQLLRDIDAAMAAAPNPVVKGVLWVQGERDTNSAATAEAYEASLEHFVLRLRELYGEDFVFVISQLSEDMQALGSRPNTETVIAAQANVAAKYDFVKLIDPDDVAAAEGLTVDDVISDAIHYDETGSRLIADAFARDVLAAKAMDHGDMGQKEAMDHQHGDAPVDPAAPMPEDAGGQGPGAGGHGGDHSPAPAAPGTVRTLEPGVSETASAGAEIVEGFVLGEDAVELTMAAEGGGTQTVSLSTANDFVGFVAAAGTSARAIVAGPEQGADLVLTLLDADGSATESVTLRGLATDIGTGLLERAGAERDVAGGGSGAHDHTEHVAPTTLVSEEIDAFATHVAVQNGDWTDPATWADGEVPGEGAIVHIPADVAVSYGANAGEAHLFYVHVDGGLSISSAEGPSRMVVDTIYTTPGSTFEADASSGNLLDIAITPFDANRIEGLSDDRDYFANGVREGSDGNGVLGRYEWDPSQVSLGIVTEGSVKIAGAEKAAHLELGATAGPGAQAIALDLDGLGLAPDLSAADVIAAVGWAEGDLIAVGSSEFGT
ncbi:MAG: sialate O-acetylesterase, partial [Pseudomonadota bacterium]